MDGQSNKHSPKRFCGTLKTGRKDKQIGYTWYTDEDAEG